MALNLRQQRFLAAYLLDPSNATAAAKAAGYSEKTAYAQGSALLKHPEIAAALAAHTSKALVKVDSSVERITRELAAIGFADLRRVMAEDGKLLPPSQWPDEIAVCIASIETTRRVLNNGIRKVKDPDEGEDVLVHEEEAEVITKIKLWPKVEALKLLAVYRKMLTGDIIPPDQRQTFVGLAITVAPGAQVQVNIGKGDK